MKFLKRLFWPLLYLILAIIFIVVVRALDSRSLPDLKSWHNTSMDKELLISRDYQDIDSYLKDEDVYIRAMFAKVSEKATGKFNRYNPESKSYPLFKDDNLNASFIADPGVKQTKGVILLLHGLTDSPYHMRALSEVFKKEGFYVLALRLPGHGTLPSGLLNVTWQQWQKASDWGALQLNKIAKERGDVPLYMGGFSTGGALILNYSLRALDNSDLRIPDKLFMFSPAIGVSKMGALSAWHKSLSWMNYFKKFRWLDVLPEYDPAKYNSFSKNAGRQVYLLTLENKELTKRVAEAKRQNEVPAIISFQSLVDATVIPLDLLEMYQEIGTSKDELFVYGINRVYKDFIEKSVLEINPREITFEQEDKPVLHMLINNLVFDSIQGPIACGIYEKTSNDSLIDVYPNHHSYWPLEFFAMSHVAVPIAPDNAAYGAFSVMGRLSVKGERDVLLVPSDDIMRIRYNPFFDLMSREIHDFIIK
ncbi:MAG: alpha/beta fold hydrolase [Bacteroidales bacterium]|nr:alpha/beta fold hydrolase [Bacteroidales bacterium]